MQNSFKSFNIRTFFALLSFYCKTFGHLKIICHIKDWNPPEPRAEKIINSKTLADFLTAVSPKPSFVWRPIQKADMFCGILL